MGKKDQKKQIFFTEKLLDWNKNQNKRAMPWKNEKDPYKIWISEIILQQTRVEQGLDYYNRFIKRYPDVRKLAKANDNEVFKLWEGLGYYSRCRNLLATARYISNQFGGKFPEKYEAIILLKGVGSYTAAAISSFAYNLPYAVVDGNVIRVLARFFGISDPVDTSAGKKKFNNLAQMLLKKDEAAIYNQAIMDFGATVCKPKSPDCKNCRLSAFCHSFHQGSYHDFPVKSKSVAVKMRFFNYIIAEYDGAFYIRKRIEKDIWKDLHEFILIESDKPITKHDIKKIDEFKHLNPGDFELTDISAIFIQKLTHQQISGQFFHVRLKKPLTENKFVLKSRRQIKNLAFPRMIDDYIKKKLLV